MNHTLRNIIAIGTMLAGLVPSLAYAQTASAADYGMVHLSGASANAIEAAVATQVKRSGPAVLSDIRDTQVHVQADSSGVTVQFGGPTNNRLVSEVHVSGSVDAEASVSGDYATALYLVKQYIQKNRINIDPTVAKTVSFAYGKPIGLHSYRQKVSVSFAKPNTPQAGPGRFNLCDPPSFTVDLATGIATMHPGMC